MRSDQGGEYYWLFDEDGQNLGPFAKLLQSQCICAHTLPSTPHQNDVVER